MELPAPMMSAAAPPAAVRSPESFSSAASRAAGSVPPPFMSLSSSAMTWSASAWTRSIVEPSTAPAASMVPAAPVTTSQSLTRWKRASTRARLEAGRVKAYCVPRSSRRWHCTGAPVSSMTLRAASS